MPYIGRDTDKISNVEVLDNITFDGSSSYTLQKGGSNFTPSSANTLLLSIDGVVQAGNFTVSGSTINFGTAVAGTSTCDFVLHYGVGLITAPSDGTVTTAKLADSSVSLAKLTATGTKDATTFLRGDNTFATAGVTGKTIRATAVVQDGSGYTLSNSGFTNFGSGLSYTPATTTSQVMAFVEVVCYAVSDASDNDARTTIKFGTNNSSGNTIYESTNGTRNLGYVNINDPTFYNQISTTISTCQRNSSNNVVVVIGCDSNADPGTTIGMGHMKAVFMEIE
jgi:hypothetical protein